MPKTGAARKARLAQPIPSPYADLKSMPLRDRKKIQQRAALIQIALKLFRDKGFEDTRMEDIAGLADVSTPTVYNYFTNKRDVLVEVLKQDRLDSKELFEKIVSNPPIEPESAFAALIHANMAGIRRPEDKRLWREILSAVARSHDREQDPFEDNHEVFKTYIERLLIHYIGNGKLSQDLPVEVAVDVIFAVNSQNLRHIASSERSSPEKVRDTALKQISFILARWHTSGANARTGKSRMRQ
jgi:AcrR family transcriptional regulator